MPAVVFFAELPETPAVRDAVFAVLQNGSGVAIFAPFATQVCEVTGDGRGVTIRHKTQTVAKSIKYNQKITRRKVKNLLY